jgi:hypothetical protein
MTIPALLKHALREKIALYHAHEIWTTVGGSLYEVAAVNGMVGKCLNQAAEIGFRGVEVSGDLNRAPRPRRAQEPYRSRQKPVAAKLLPHSIDVHR